MPTLPELDPKTGICLSPYVVVLGAGASAAVCPNGDRNGKRLPIMRDFLNTVGLEHLVEESGYSHSGEINFEEFYDWLAHSNDHRQLLEELERKVYDYFADIQIPDGPTAYDYLLLGLRPKDLIATFNWDPLLAQAFDRNRSMRQLPQIVFLHGNVAVGTCLEHRVKAFIWDSCRHCGAPMQPTKLLYPISRKDYNSDIFIRSEWQILTEFIRRAYLLMIFGYSAPKTDVEAREIMQKAWQANSTMELAEIEMVDLKSSKELSELWKDFIVRNHYGVSDRISHTWIFRHPRRTCEAFAAATLQNSPLHDEPIPAFQTLHDLQKWFSHLISEEDAFRSNGTPFRKVIPLRPHHRT